jgi:hypothetical protein
MRLAFGPGNGMSKWGNFVSVAAIISSSFKDGQG